MDSHNTQVTTTTVVILSNRFNNISPPPGLGHSPTHRRGYSAPALFQRARFTPLPLWTHKITYFRGDSGTIINIWRVYSLFVIWTSPKSKIWEIWIKRLILFFVRFQPKFQMAIHTMDLVEDIVRLFTSENMELKKLCALAIFKVRTFDISYGILFLFNFESVRSS